MSSSDQRPTSEYRPSELPRHPAVSPPISPVFAPNTGGRLWATNNCDCCMDEETCWWGFWCCCLVHARTVATFNSDSSANTLLKFWAPILLFPIFILIAPRLGTLYILFAIIYMVYDRTLFRKQIRESLGIIADVSNDFCMHCCCACCSICQEAREAKFSRPSYILDYCSGQPISELEEAHERAVGRLAVSVSDVMIPPNGSVYTHFSAISFTTKIIYYTWLAIGLISLIVLIANGQSSQLTVIFFVFLQPFLILYFVYWIYRRQWASLDMVLKMFAVGFWFTPLQAGIIEIILQVVMAVVATSVFGLDLSALQGITDDSGTDDEKSSSGISLSSSRNPFTNRLSNTIFGGVWYLLFQNSNQGVDGYQPLDIGSSAASVGDDSVAGTVRETLSSNILLVLALLFFMSYVVAAGTEETMKHFALRCCQLGSPLKDPHTILVYLLSAALGFATAENIEYVFSSGNPLPGASLIEGEFIILALRILMPVHAICSVLQAVNLSKFLLEQQPMSLFGILLPALILHGTFDFSIFLIGTIQFVYDINTVGMLVLSFLVPIVITIVGTVWAYRSFCQVQSNFENGWQSFQSTDEEDRL